MRFSSAALALAASVGIVDAAAVPANTGIKGFNYGAFFLNQQAKVQSDFAYEFNRAKSLPGTSGWANARLYTMVQWGTKSDIVSAIPAAIETNTKLLLGLWISGGPQAITNEITALKAAISKHGSKFTNLVVGISVGSEDLYRDAAGEVGTSAAYLVDCIKKVRAAVAGTALAGVPIGHVDTYDTYLNGTNKAVIPAIDWVGFDGYPYWEGTKANSINDAMTRFYDGYDKTVKLAGSKPVWVTETGWPITGKKNNLAVPSAANARIYWQKIACTLIQKKINVFWYGLQESQWGTASPDFGIYGPGDLGTLQPRHSLAC
ncbi:putative glycoside hydrolase family 17 protein [Rosellinia necatrix]|uniref:glucan endo-1,3-beta-D-glucosidase n=1 Tax=Rosellinia necatrix TaxID=77044 RepID=A0A1S7UIH5_ROSNE|nr:putative glycoside hydrolase family 17 protein [Rosellinia necatrix]